MKYIINEISMPLTVIIYQMLATGIFPDNLKTAKIHLSLKADTLLATDQFPF